MGIETGTAILIGSIIAGVGAAASANEAYQGRKAQKTAQRNQRKQIAKENADALAMRKDQINQMREQLNVGGYQTSSTQGGASAPVVKGTLGDKLG